MVNKLKHNNKTYIYIVIALFILAVLFWTIYGGYPKKITTYKDELIYYSIAQNFAKGRGLTTIYGSKEYSINRFLYSIVISPAFLADNRIVQFRILAFISSLVICSGIIPTALLAKKLLSDLKYQVLACLLYIFSVDLAYSIVFMSDVVFYPICLWFFYFIYSYLIDHKIKDLILICILSVIGIFAKRAMLVMIGCFGIVLLIDYFFVRDKTIQRNKTKLNVFIIAVAFLLLFSAIFIAYKMGFIAIGLNYITRLIAMIKESPFSIIKVNAYYLMHLVAGMIGLPLLVPYVYIDKFSKTNRLYILLLTLVLICYAIVNFVHVLGPMNDARVSYRYIMFLVPIFNILLLKVFEDKLNTNNDNSDYIRWAIILLFGVAMFAFYQGVFRASVVDYMSLGYVYMLEHISIRTLKTVILLFFVIETIMYFWNKKILLYSFLVFFVIAQYFSFASHVEFIKMIYSISDVMLDATLKSEEFVKEHSDEKILVIHEYLDVNEDGEYINSGPNRMADTYLNYANTIHSSMDRLMKYDFIDGEGIDINVNKIAVAFGMTKEADKNYPDAHIDYIFVPESCVSKVDENLCEKISVEGSLFNIYKLNNPNILPFKNAQ